MRSRSVRVTVHGSRRLVESLDGEIDNDSEEAWAAEIERRLAKIDAGQAKLLSMDDAVARLHRAARTR